MDIEKNIQYLKGVGPKKAYALGRLGIKNIYDLITYYPKRYNDQSEIENISSVKADEVVNISGRILNIQERASRQGMKITTAILADDTGSIQLVWFNQPFVKKTIKINEHLFVQGKIGYAYGGYGQLAVKQVISYFSLDTAGKKRNKFLPVYLLPEIIKPKFFRELIQRVLEKIDNIPCALAEPLRKKNQLLAKEDALRAIHFPASRNQLATARKMLIFEELFMIQCGLIYIRRLNDKNKHSIRCLGNNKLVRQLQQKLPFQLTNDQSRAWKEICHDMESAIPMQRLLQGDVGSGKTVIAMLALVKAVENGYQGTLMAPTEILARQHFNIFCTILQNLNIKTGILVGSLPAKAHKNALEKIANGQWQIVIGTHALIQDKVKFFNLGLVVTDEQHRFGIAQRANLETKAKCTPDVLIMTATPIPRTMTLTVYGDLDVSSLKHLPPGRKPVRTFLRTRTARPKIYKFLHDKIDEGRQAYVVCPLIELSDDINAISAEAVFKELSSGIFKDVNCALLHGKLPSREKEKIMQDFLDNKIQLLIATTVIEVGINVPNASIMVIEGADRFGLAQLHQLRGRIGRGQYRSYCILLSDNKNDKSRQRLSLMEKISDGFQLAEEDLLLRGPGQFFGSMQHGLPDLKIANVLSDAAILLDARKAAEEWCNNKSNDMNSIIQTIKLQYKNNFFKITDV
nr:ATP-dependent DNA helicase RecG [Pectinatus sottacetonis]